MMKFIYTAIFLSFILPVPITSTYAAIPADIVVAAWTFEGDGAIVEDISGNGHDREPIRFYSSPRRTTTRPGPARSG
jgi:hypothetical protein